MAPEWWSSWNGLESIALKLLPRPMWSNFANSLSMRARCHSWGQPKSTNIWLGSEAFVDVWFHPDARLDRLWARNISNISICKYQKLDDEGIIIFVSKQTFGKKTSYKNGRCWLTEFSRNRSTSVALLGVQHSGTLICSPKIKYWDDMVLDALSEIWLILPGRRGKQ